MDDLDLSEFLCDLPNEPGIKVEVPDFPDFNLMSEELLTCTNKIEKQIEEAVTEEKDQGSADSRNSLGRCKPPLSEDEIKRKEKVLH